MSSVGQAVGYVAGAVIGAFIPGGYIMLGAAIGGMIGSAIDPPKGPKIEGPRLNDLSQQTSSLGAPIPRLHGDCTLFGNVFWIENNALTEHSKTEEQGGKGGPTSETTTYSYTATFALGLCEGEVDALSRIWINGKLFFDALSTDQPTLLASNLARYGGLMDGQYYAPAFTFYSGSATQAADPRMQADLGVANTPAYRGLCYIVFNDLDLTDYGNTIAGAQIKVELFKSATETTLITSHNNLPSAISWYGLAYGSPARNHGFVAVSRSGVGAYSQNGVDWVQTALPTSGGAYMVAYGNGVYVGPGGDETFAIVSRDGINWTAGNNYPEFTFATLIHFNGEAFMAFGAPQDEYFISSDGVSWSAPLYLGSSSQWSAAATNAVGLTCLISSSGPSNTRPRSATLDGTDYISEALMPDGVTWVSVATDGVAFVAVGYGFGEFDQWATRSTDGLTWSTPVQLEEPGLATRAASVSYGAGHWVVAGYDELGLSGGLFSSTDGINWSVLSVQPSFGPWRTVFDGAYFVIAGLTSTHVRRVRFDAPQASGLALSSIVSAECLSAGILGAGDIDVTSLTDTVRGYRISNVGALRAAIEPLRGAWPFDVAQAGYKVKFVRRGALSSVATVEEDDLGATASGAPGVRLSSSREMDIQLPRRVTIKYLDAGRDHEANEQYAERLNTSAINVTDLDMAIVMTADEAAQKAETLLYMYWLERHDLSFNLPPTFRHLEPADVVTVETAAATYSLRLTEINLLPDGILECKAKLNDNAVYSSSAVGVTGDVAAQTISVNPASLFEVMDIPTISDDYNRAGMPVAMCGYSSSWRGGSLFRSADAGQTWASTNSFVNASTIGYAIDAIGAPADTRMVDTSSRLTVALYGGKTLSSIARLQMLNGANHFAYETTAGQWEIIAAQNCTLQANGNYVLTNLMRGRFGTERLVASHSTGNALVLLDRATLQWMNLSTNQIGLRQDYRGVSFGAGIDSSLTTVLTYSATNLECLAPVFLNGSRHPTTRDWSLTWIRRTRIGGEWRDLVDASLGETAETYEIDIYADATYQVVKRTLSVTTTAATYTSAQQVADFGANQATLYLIAFQTNTIVGRGIPLITSITRG